MLASGNTVKTGRFIINTYCIYWNFWVIPERRKSESVISVFTEHNCCFSCLHLAHKVRTWWVLSALLYTCRLICACTTAICLMWLVWGFLGIPKVATIRLRGPYITAEDMFVCNIFQPAFQLKKENNVLGSGSLYFMAALQFSNTNTLVPLQCKSSTSIFQNKKVQTVFIAAHGLLWS